MTSLATWRKQRIAIGVVLMVVGLGIMILGAALIGANRGGDVTNAAWVGSFGVLLIVIGGWLCRVGFAGPFPRRFTEERP